MFFVSWNSLFGENLDVFIGDFSVSMLVKDFR